MSSQTFNIDVLKFFFYMNKSTESKESQKDSFKINKKMKPKQCNYYFTSATLMMTKN